MTHAPTWLADAALQAFFAATQAAGGEVRVVGGAVRDFLLGAPEGDIDCASTLLPAQTIAVAQDVAFAFAYPHLLADWRAQGAEIRPFSPLADDPVPEAGFVFLPGGYPELHAGRLAANTRFLSGLRTAAQAGTPIYGECGGYMVLGDGLIDAQGARHEMAGLLRLETSFAHRKLHLGYRTVQASQGPMSGIWAAHEFHYATTVKAEGAPLFTARDAEGTPLPDMGLVQGAVCGSFAHLIDRAFPAPAQGVIPDA